MITKEKKEDERTKNQIKEQYEIEKELANKLRFSDRKDRKKLYSSSYDELFKRIPHHPQVYRKSKKIEIKKTINNQLNLLRKFITPSMKLCTASPIKFI